MCEGALRIKKVALGDDHASVAVTLGNMGNLLKKQGRIGEGRVCLERAHAIFLERLGPSHPKTRKVAKGLRDL